MEQGKSEAFYCPAGAGRGGEHGAHHPRLEAETAVLRGTVPPEGEPQVGRASQEPDRRVVRCVLGAVPRTDAAARTRHRGGAQGVGQADAGRAGGGYRQHGDVSLSAAVHRSGKVGAQLSADEEFRDQLRGTGCKNWMI